MKWLWQKQLIIDWRLWIKLHETQSINKDYRTNSMEISGVKQKMGEKAWLKISLYLQVLMLTGWSDIWCCGTRAACLWQQPGTGGWAWQLQFCQTQIRPRWRGIGHGSYHVGSAKHGLSQHSCRTKRETFSTKSRLSKGVNDIKHNCTQKSNQFFFAHTWSSFFPFHCTWFSFPL